MNGGGGGGGSYVSSGGAYDPDACETLNFQATLHSPQPAAVAALTVGERLLVTLGDEAGARVVQAHTEAGILVGTLVTGLAKLLACMARGFTFAGEVKSLDDGEVIVHVRAA